MNAHQHAQSSRHYETEAEAIRYRLAQSLAELRDRLTPDQLFEEMMIYARGGVGTFFHALSNAARENPLSTFLVGADVRVGKNGDEPLPRSAQQNDLGSLAGEGDAAPSQ